MKEIICSLFCFAYLDFHRHCMLFLQIPFPINVPQFPGGVGGPPVLPPPMPTHLPPAGVPPPLTQLGPSPQKQRSVHEMTMLHQRSVAALPYVIPPRLKERFKELHLTDTMFMCLLKIYEEAREDYINTLKKGYLMFFPFLIGARWKEQYPNWPIPGTKLMLILYRYFEQQLCCIFTRPQSHTHTQN